jgi:phosphoribosyl-AMP cyclohydrolase
MSNKLLKQVSWNEQGLVAAIAQDASSGRVLMMAWMNDAALTETLETGYATYWSRSRGQIWRKGESSGNRQKVEAIELDCDGDAVLLQVEQEGGIACHTGRNSCFYRRAENDEWVENEPVLKSPEEIYPNE